MTTVLDYNNYPVSFAWCSCNNRTHHNSKDIVCGMIFVWISLHQTNSLGLKQDRHVSLIERVSTSLNKNIHWNEITRTRLKARRCSLKIQPQNADTKCNLGTVLLFIIAIVPKNRSYRCYFRFLFGSTKNVLQ